MCWVRGCAENAHAPTGVVDNGDDVLAYAGQRDGLDEIHRQDHLGLGAQELGPCDGHSVWRRVDPSSFEDLPHGRRSDRDTKKGEFSVDAPIAPRGVLGRQTQDKATNRCHGARTP